MSNFWRKFGASAYGLGEGVLDTLTFGATDSLTDTLWDKSINKGTDLKALNQFRGGGNMAGALGTGIFTGNVSGAINEGLEGFADIAENSNNQKFQKASTYANLGAQLSGFTSGANNLNDFGSQMAMFAQQSSKGMDMMNSFMSTIPQKSEPISVNQSAMSNKQSLRFALGGLVNYKNGGPIKPIVLANNDYDRDFAPKEGNYLLPDINRPFYVDNNGQRRSEFKMGLNINDTELLIPTVVNGKQLNEEQAIKRYLDTGYHMGKFNTANEANLASLLRTARYNMFNDPVRFTKPLYKNGSFIKNNEDYLMQMLLGGFVNNY